MPMGAAPASTSPNSWLSSKELMAMLPLMTGMTTKSILKQADRQKKKGKTTTQAKYHSKPQKKNENARRKARNPKHDRGRIQQETERGTSVEPLVLSCLVLSCLVFSSPLLSSPLLSSPLLSSVSAPSTTPLPSVAAYNGPGFAFEADMQSSSSSMACLQHKYETRQSKQELQTGRRTDR